MSAFKIQSRCSQCLRLATLVCLTISELAANAAGHVAPIGIEVVEGPVDQWSDPYGKHRLRTKREACRSVAANTLGGGVVGSVVSIGPETYHRTYGYVFVTCDIRAPHTGTRHDYWSIAYCAGAGYAPWNGSNAYCRVDQPRCPANASAVGSPMQCRCNTGYEPTGPRRSVSCRRAESTTPARSNTPLTTGTKTR